jgi:hypothetical protein
MHPAETEPYSQLPIQYFQQPRMLCTVLYSLVAEGTYVKSSHAVCTKDNSTAGDSREWAGQLDSPASPDLNRPDGGTSNKVDLHGHLWPLVKALGNPWLLGTSTRSPPPMISSTNPWYYLAMVGWHMKQHA